MPDYYLDSMSPLFKRWEDEVRIKYHLYSLRIDGVEVTQAIQYFGAEQHLTDPADRGPDNSVRLVANKQAWIRVYVSSGLFNQIQGVSGTVEVARRRLGALWDTITTLTPQPPGTVTALANPHYIDQRSNIDRSLNFIIPADVMIGHLRLKVRINTPNSTDLAEFTVDINATLKQTLRLAGIMVGYNGPDPQLPPGSPNLVLAAPGLADLQTTSAWTLLTYPVQTNATYRTAGTITLTIPLNDAATGPGKCSPNWGSLLNEIQKAKMADGNKTDVIYYGLLALGIPMGPIIGCSGGGNNSGSNTDQVTMAHEIGHCLGFLHAPCGVGGDANYPAYEPYDPQNTPTASIGEFGLDISTGTIQSPSIMKDFMSYCGPDWISLFSYGKLINNKLLDPHIVGEDSLIWPDYKLVDPYWWIRHPMPEPDGPDWEIRMQRYYKPEPVISIIGIVHTENEIEVRNVSRLIAEKYVHRGEFTDFTVQLLDESERVLASGPVYRIVLKGQGPDGNADPERWKRPPYSFQALLPDHAESPGSLLRITKNKEVVWKREAPVSKPEITEFSVKPSKEHQFYAEWRERHADKQVPEFWIRWSTDGGESWHPLQIGLTGRKAIIEESSLPSGEIQLQLLLHDGFFTATSESAAIYVPKRPPTLAIMHPINGRILRAGGPLRFWGVATDRTRETYRILIRTLAS